MTWWERYYEDARLKFKGKLFSPNKFQKVKQVDIDPHRVSGVGAIKLAIHYGAKRVVLLGYDCQYTGGKKHWHGNHPAGLGNAVSIQHWPMRFAQFVNKMSKDVTVINASRQTALQCFERMDLEQALCW